MTWKFFRGKGLSRETLRQLADRVVPNFIILNQVLPVKMEQKPSIKNPVEIVFTVQDVPAFQPETMSLPDLVLKMNLRLYYGNQTSAEAYWGEQSRELYDDLQEFWEDDSKLEKAVKEFEALPTPEEKMKAAYDWIQNNLKNTQYEDGDEFDENESVNDVLKHGYGTSTDINKVFVDLLRSMNIDAKLAYVVDRDEGLFIPKVKYWQFSRSIVFVELGGEKHGFYNPAQKFLPFGSLAWYNEGGLAFIVGSMNHMFLVTPSSAANRNQIIKYFKWSMDSSLAITGTAKCTYSGHPARRLRFRLEDITPEEQRHFFKKEARKILGYCEADSFEIRNPENLIRPVVWRFKTHLPQIGHKDGALFFIKPLQFVRSQNYKFYDEKRNFSVALDYAKKLIDIISLTIPAGMELVAVPPNGTFENQIGSIVITYRWVESEHALVIQRLFILKKSFIHPNDYPMLRNLLDETDHLNSAPVILQRAKSSANQIPGT